MISEGDMEDPKETYNEVAEQVEQKAFGKPSEEPPEEPPGEPLEASEPTEAPRESKEEPKEKPKDKPKRKIYEKEQCTLCKRWLSANTLRWKHDCRKQEKGPRNKRPHLTRVPLETEEAPPTRIEEPQPPPPQALRLATEERPLTLHELRDMARQTRRDKFMSKMFGLSLIHI